jgi:hypothetical protein
MTTSKDSTSWEERLVQRIHEAKPRGVPLALLAGKPLFHYTTALGLKGIVEHNCIWATAASYLNDASEIEYGAALLEEVFEEWIAANKDNDSWAIKILRSLRVIFSDPASRLEQATRIYVTCFCENDNLLSQWRAYGQAGGYSIGFFLLGVGLQLIEPRLATLKAEAENDYHHTSLVRVVYDRAEQRERLHAILRIMLPLLNDDLSDVRIEVMKLGTNAMQKMAAIAILFLKEIFLEEIAAFKNKAFAEEREWRIVVRSRVSKQIVPEGEDDLPWMNLRAARGLLVPYVKIVPTDGLLPITSVRFGPSLDRGRADHSVNALLGLKGYTRVTVHGSDIPVVL